MENIYYTTIIYKSNFKNDNWRAGGAASTFMSNNRDGKPFKMEIGQFGKTKEEAKEKLIKFLNGDGKNNIECIGEFKNKD